MAAPLVVPLPPRLVVSGGYTIEVTAVSPTTGAVVPGVNVSDITFEVDVISGGTADAAGSILLLPAG